MSTARNVIIVHGCPSSYEQSLDATTRTYDKHRMPWIEKEIGNIGGGVVYRPLMPKPRERIYAMFEQEFEKYNIVINEQSVLIGHSCGCAFLVRWLGENNKKIAKLILVAPRKVRSKKGEKTRTQKSDLYDFNINSLLVERIKEIIMFTSNNETQEGKESLQEYHRLLGGKIINLPHHGHYTLNDMGTEEFPELLKVILY